MSILVVTDSYVLDYDVFNNYVELKFVRKRFSFGDNNLTKMFYLIVVAILVYGTATKMHSIVLVILNRGEANKINYTVSMF